MQCLHKTLSIVHKLLRVPLQILRQEFRRHDMTWRQHSSSYKKKRKHAVTCLYRNSWDHWLRMLQKSLPQKEEATCAAHVEDDALGHRANWILQGKGLSSKVGVPRRVSSWIMWSLNSSFDMLSCISFACSATKNALRKGWSYLAAWQTQSVLKLRTQQNTCIFSYLNFILCRSAIAAWCACQCIEDGRAVTTFHSTD